MDIEKFPDILFTLVSIQSFLSCESFSDFSKLVFDSFGLRLFVFALPDVRDELVEATHVGGPAHETTEDTHDSFEF